MTLALDMLLDIASEKNGYVIGSPWRFSEFSLAAIVPIQRMTEAQRPYRLLSEVRDEVRMKDTGSINQVEIANESGLPVLLKAGEMVGGATQTRALTASQVIMARERLVVGCVCVHASKGIRQGQEVKQAGYAPTEVRAIMHRAWGDRSGPANRGEISRRVGFNYTSQLQQEVWGQVKGYSAGVAQSAHNLYSASQRYSAAMAGAVAAQPGFTTPADDLAGRIRESENTLKEVIRSVPHFDNQVGICLISLAGFQSMEGFDHSQSWDAFRGSLLGAEASKIADVTDQDGVFEFRADKAKATIRQLLTAGFEESTTIEKEGAATFLLRSERLMGEVVALYGQPIHCSFLKKS